MATPALLFGDFKGFWKLRARARITSHVWVLRYLSGKERGLVILLVWKGRATPSEGRIDAQTGEVIVAGALTKRKAVSPFRETVL